ncbi:MAG: rod shape-determining protein MreD [bacterium]
MRASFYVFLFFVSLILQITIAPLFSIREITPDLILVMVIIIAIQKGRVWGVVAGCLAGLIFDLFGAGLVGLSSLTKTVAGYTAGFLGSERIERRLSVVVGLLFLSILIHDLLYFSILSIGTAISIWKTFARYVLPTSFYTLIFALVIHLIWPKVLWGKIEEY